MPVIEHADRRTAAVTQFIFEILKGTPAWVWALLAFLIWRGLVQARDHVVTKSRLMVQPVSMTLLSLWGASSAFGPHPWVLASWLLGLGLGFALNHAIGMPRRVRQLPGNAFALDGSWTPMALLMAIFAMRYIVAVALAINPGFAASVAFAATASVVYGLPAGILLSRAFVVLGGPRRAATPVAA